MTALSSDSIRDSRVRNNVAEDTASVATSATVFVGSLLMFDALGRLRAATPSAARRPAGVCTGIVNESGTPIASATGNAAGTIKATFEYDLEVLVNVATAARTQANLNKNVFILTDNDVTDTTGAGTASLRIKIGSLTQFANSAKSQAWIAVRKLGDADAV